MRNRREIGSDDPDTGADDWLGCFGRLGAEDGRLRHRRTCARGRAAQGALLGVTATAASWVEVCTGLVGVAVEVMKQSVGAWYGGTGTEEHDEEKERNEPLPHGQIIPGLTFRRMGQGRDPRHL
jgi:hypothetical protein